MADETVTVKKEGEPATPAAVEKSPEEIKKEENLANLDKAILEANTELDQIRKDTKAGKEKPAPAAGEEEVPAIDDEDPGARAWNGRIRENVAPIQTELEQGRAEIRTFALREFLSNKPALAANPEKVKELISYYERIRTATERTKEGVLLDLDKAYAIVFHQEILDAARRGDIEGARLAGVAADVGVDRGATTYHNDKPKASRNLSASDLAILAKWGVAPEEWQEDAKKYGIAQG